MTIYVNEKHHFSKFVYAIHSAEGVTIDLSGGCRRRGLTCLFFITFFFWSWFREVHSGSLYRAPTSIVQVILWSRVISAMFSMKVTPWYRAAFFVSSLKTYFLPIPKKQLEVSHPEIRNRWSCSDFSIYDIYSAVKRYIALCICVCRLSTHLKIQIQGSNGMKTIYHQCHYICIWIKNTDCVSALQWCIPNMQ